MTACAARPLSSREIQVAAGLRHRETFQRNYLDQIISDGLVERTIPEKPTSRLQKYRLTEKGRGLLEKLDKKSGRS
ncbi:MAG: cell filamentation protein Fic [Desulfomicrobium sp.]|nr:cell filamentation protein Fic [Desulfomicrobium sp.]